ncbi:hypothetical protein [Bartonella sp. MR100HLJHH]|uniref:hypothetical protein n=1 Tax=Bartonella sp. MR100HLJHH TaxID=3243554 RepID=UPI0035CF4CE9
MLCKEAVPLQSLSIPEHPLESPHTLYIIGFANEQSPSLRLSNSILISTAPKPNVFTLLTRAYPLLTGLRQHNLMGRYVIRRHGIKLKTANCV